MAAETTSEATMIGALVGIMLITLTGMPGLSAQQQIVNVAPYPSVKIVICPGWGNPPALVTELVDRYPDKTYILRSCDPSSTGAIDPQAIIDDYSPYLPIVRSHPSTTFWLELGNEPNVAGMNPWIYRWLALDDYKTVARGDHWLTEYPNLHWMLNLPTTVQQERIVLQFLGNGQSDPIGAGGVLDLYQAVSEHPYSGSTTFDDPTWLAADRYLRRSPYVHVIWLTEMGLNTDRLSWSAKYAEFEKLSESSPKYAGGQIFAEGSSGYADANGWGNYVQPW